MVLFGLKQFKIISDLSQDQKNQIISFFFFFFFLSFTLLNDYILVVNQYKYNIYLSSQF